MLFNSIPFLLFFPIICLGYFLIPMRYSRGRNMLLLVASYFFYMNWKAEYALLLLTSTLITYYGALWISKLQKKKELLLFLTIGSNLAILFFFKRKFTEKR